MTHRARPGVQCNADHIVTRKSGRFYYYCVLPELHGGMHMDYRGNTWALMWPHLATVFRGWFKKHTRY